MMDAASAKVTQRAVGRLGASPEGAYEGLDWGKGDLPILRTQFGRIARCECSGKHARHVLEICERIFESANKGMPIDVGSRFPAPVPVGHPPPWS